jgi:hypothetical protein
MGLLLVMIGQLTRAGDRCRHEKCPLASGL